MSTEGRCVYGRHPFRPGYDAVESDPVILTGDFDGGNPKDAEAIVQTGERAFLIRPFSESGDPNYRFRLDVVASNTSCRTETIDLRILWEEPIYQAFRDYLWLKGPNDLDWKFKKGFIDGSSTSLSVELAPGDTYLCMHPKYSYEDYLRFIARVPTDDGVTKELIGRTAEGREIWCLHASLGVRGFHTRVLGVFRVHPYETAGSFCAEGIMECLDAIRRELQRKASEAMVDLYLIPMANPDGVFNGYEKLTSVNGVDLSKVIDPSDSSSSAITTAIDRIKPHIYFEFHNWMHKDIDGIYHLNYWQCRKFMRLMPSQAHNRKKWRPMLRRRLFAEVPMGFKKYCRERYGSVVACFEYPWFGRTILDMKKLGADTVVALANM